MTLYVIQREREKKNETAHTLPCNSWFLEVSLKVQSVRPEMEILAHNYVLITEYSTVTKNCCVSVTISSSTGTTLLDHHSSTAAQRGHNRTIPPESAFHVFGCFEGGWEFDRVCCNLQPNCCSKILHSGQVGNMCNMKGLYCPVAFSHLWPNYFAFYGLELKPDQHQIDRQSMWLVGQHCGVFSS